MQLAAAAFLSYCAFRDEWVELLGSTPSDSLLKIVGITRAVWAEIEASKNPFVPRACYQLAQYQRYLQLSDLLGPSWAEFEVRGSTLLFPGLKYPLSAADLRATWARLQQIRALEATASLLRSDLKKAEAAIEAAEKRAGYFRQLVSLEARTGLMLSRIAA